MSTPLISVVLPAYNAENFLATSIKSILEQTYENYELIIINDGSTDRTDSIISSFNDPRIRYVVNSSNLGLITTLNKGIKLSKGDFIARMDADDIAISTRLEKQVSIMLSDSNIVVCGSQVQGISEKGNDINKKYKYYESSHDIVNNMLNMCPFAHPTVLIRKSILVNNQIIYDEDFKDAEDYKLWCDLMDYGDFVNSSDVLLKYRTSNTQITQSSNLVQKSSARRCRRLIFKKLYPNYTLPSKINVDYIHSNLSFIIKNNLLSIFLLSLENYSLKLYIELIRRKIIFSTPLLTLLRMFKRSINGTDRLI